MHAISINGSIAHVSVTGPEDGPAFVFSNSLGTDFRIWDRLIARLPQHYRFIRYDKRGHGLSDCPPGPWSMDDLVSDLAAILDQLSVKDAIVCGLSVGGIIAQGIAASRPDLVKALILSDTAAHIGPSTMWDTRIAAIETGGIASVSDAILARWFPETFRTDRTDELALWRNMLTRCSVPGYIGVCDAIRDADLREQTATLTVPCLAMVGDEDLSTPPALVQETAALIPGSRFKVIAQSGHLPCIDQPDQVAALINDFIGSLDNS